MEPAVDETKSGETGLEVNVENVGFARDNESVTINSEIAKKPPYQFIGYGKQELLKYANEPFWVRLRWILFICCWIAWFSLLAGAIIMIVLAPKCGGSGARVGEIDDANLSLDTPKMDFWVDSEEGQKMEELVFSL